MIEKYYEYLSANYNGRQWSINGPRALSRVAWDACHVNAHNATGTDCFNVTAYKKKWFNPVNWNWCGWFFQEDAKDKVLELTSGSYTAHFANKLSSGQILDMNLDTAFKALAKKNCPYSVEVLKMHSYSRVSNRRRAPLRN